MLRTLDVVFFSALLSCVYSICPLGYTNYKRQACFRFFYYESEVITNQQAQANCKNFSNGQLATIDDARQEKFLHDTFFYDKDARYTVWIGLKRNPQNISEFIWSDGSQSSYRHWEPGEPNMFEGKPEYCVHFDVKTVESVRHYGWNDEPCDSVQVYGYICRVPYDAELNGSSDLQRSTSDLGSRLGWAVGGTIGAIILIALIVVVGLIGFRKWKKTCSTIPMVTLKNEPV